MRISSYQPELRTRLDVQRVLQRRERQDTVVSLEGVQFIGRAAAHQLLIEQEYAEKQGHPFRIVGESGDAEKVLKVVRDTRYTPPNVPNESFPVIRLDTAEQWRDFMLNFSERLKSA